MNTPKTLAPFAYDRFVSVRQASILVGCHECTVRKWISQGQLISFRAGRKFLRVRLSDLHNMLRKNAESHIKNP